MEKAFKWYIWAMLVVLVILGLMKGGGLAAISVVGFLLLGLPGFFGEVIDKENEERGCLLALVIGFGLMAIVWVLK